MWGAIAFIGLVVVFGGIAWCVYASNEGKPPRFYYFIPIFIGFGMIIFGVIFGVTEDPKELEERIRECDDKGGAYYDEDEYSCIIDIEKYLALD